MDKLKAWNASSVTLRIAAGLSFLLFFLLNAMTPYISDDFCYMFSFATGERLRGLGDIVPSMLNHAYTMNGRLLPHALEQVFNLMPKTVFDLFNSGVFLWLMLSGYCVCNAGKQRSALLYAVVVMCFWNFVPAFGQVCLWQVGALNYLWAVAFGMFFLRPYLTLYFGPESGSWFRMPGRWWQRLLFCAAAFLFGTWSEITSFVAILIAIGILLYCMKNGGRKGQARWLWLPILAAVIGYAVLHSLPAEHTKQGGLELVTLLRKIPDVTEVLEKDVGVLCTAWIVLMVLAVARKVSFSRRFASLGFALGALASNYMLIVAVNYPHRCKITALYFLILACVMLLPELLETASGLSCRAAVAVLSAAFAVNLIYGVGDVGSAWYQQRQRDAIIARALDAGEREVTLSRIYYATKYSPFFESKDLDRFEPDNWPNSYMADYYGFDRIYGTNPQTGE